MKNWINEDNVIGHCPWRQDIDDARAVADQLGIEFRVMNLMKEYRERVVAYLLDGYANGLTPNPDIMCNREIKFGVFRALAQENGFTTVATGHYAQKLNGDLVEGADPNKDQSYFLALLGPRQIADARFPIGHLAKPELRRVAREAGLATADKKDSQGICFIGEVKMQDFLRTYVPDAPGPIIRAHDGAVLGQHRGLHFYTLGQRRGIRIPSNTDHLAYVVVGKRAGDNALLIAFDHPDAPGLFQRVVRVHSISWAGEPIENSRKLEGRVRYRDPRVGLEYIPEGGGTALIKFEQPQRGLAAGQILAFYDGPKLLGGAIYQ
jgi:tRNA-specific 2-thiouridylase